MDYVEIQSTIEGLMERSRSFNLEERIMDFAVRSFKTTAEKLPAPPPGYTYRYNLLGIRCEGNDYIADGEIRLEPIDETE